MWFRVFGIKNRGLLKVLILVAAGTEKLKPNTYLLYVALI